MVIILDASALLGYLEKSSGHAKVTDALAKAAEGKARVIVPATCWGEVCAALESALGDGAGEVRAAAESFPVEFAPLDAALAGDAARLKASSKLPYLQCVAPALARRARGTLLTADPAMKAFEGRVKVEWM